MTKFYASKPPPAIKDHISEMWLLEDDGESRVGLPKPFVEFVVSMEGIHLWKASKVGEEFEYREGWLTPIQDGPRYARAVGHRKLIGARLYPWLATAWLGDLPAGNGAPPPEFTTFLGAEANEFRNWLLEAPDDEALISRFGLWLTEKLEPLKQQKHPLQERDLGHSGTVETLAKSMNMSGSTLRRSFVSQSGISPKRWLVLRRIDKLLRDPRMGDSSSNLADLAAEYGYSDQGHLCREMMRFVGTPPSAMRRRDPDFPPHMRTDE